MLRNIGKLFLIVIGSQLLIVITMQLLGLLYRQAALLVFSILTFLTLALMLFLVFRSYLIRNRALAELQKIKEIQSSQANKIPQFQEMVGRIKDTQTKAETLAALEYLKNISNTERKKSKHD